MRATASRAASAPRSSSATSDGAVERLDRLGDRAHDGEDRALDRAHHRLVRGVGAAAEARARGRRRRPRRASRHSSASPRRICERITPELPRAPMSEPRLIAWQTSAIDSAVRQRRAHRLERERHVGAGVAVGDRVDVEPVQLLLVRAHGVAEAQERLAQIGGAPGSSASASRPD